MCADITQFSGDDANSTDLVLAMEVEIDGQWGPYLLCNPDNFTDPLGGWQCTTHLNHTQPEGYPAECNEWFGLADYCTKNGKPHKVKHDVDMSECCVEGYPNHNQLTSYYTIYNRTTRECGVYGLDAPEVVYCGEGSNTYFSYY